MKVHFVIVVGASRIAETNHAGYLVGVAGLGGFMVSSVVGTIVVILPLVPSLSLFVAASSCHIIPFVGVFTL